jgi:phosphoketolase
MNATTVAPTTPGSIHEGGELGCSLSHAFGAAFDNPDLIVACVVGDGEAETGPLATLHPFHRSVQSTDVDATGCKGFYYHFLDMTTGKRLFALSLAGL